MRTGQLVYLICIVRHVHRSSGKLRILCLLCLLCCETGKYWYRYEYCLQCCKLSNCRTHGGPITCLSLSENQLYLSGSSLGRVTVSDPLLDQPVATLKSTITAGGKDKLHFRLHFQWECLVQPLLFFTGIQTICFNQCSNLAFSGTTAGYVSCWDLRYVQINQLFVSNL